MEGRYPVKVQPLPWYGGKQSKAAWLHSLIPWRKDSTYVEPFGGMAGLLCYRAPVKCEIFNDLDGRIVNWWRMVREYPDELGRLVEGMPHSEAEYQWAKGAVDDEEETDLRRALAFYVMVTQGSVKSAHNSGWAAGYSETAVRRCSYGRVKGLCERMQNVQLFHRPATEIVERVSLLDYAVVYIDPPYHSADTKKYSERNLNIDELTSLLKGQKGCVAISGYPGEWNHLDWQRHELETTLQSMLNADKREPRTEVLWTNYDAHAEQAIGGLFA